MCFCVLNPKCVCVCLCAYMYVCVCVQVLVSAVAMGLTFGTAFQKSHVYEPFVIRAQLIFKNWYAVVCSVMSCCGVAK